MLGGRIVALQRSIWKQRSAPLCNQRARIFDLSALWNYVSANSVHVFFYAVYVASSWAVLVTTGNVYNLVVYDYFVFLKFFWRQPHGRILNAVFVGGDIFFLALVKRGKKFLTAAYWLCLRTGIWSVCSLAHYERSTDLLLRSVDDNISDSSGRI